MLPDTTFKNKLSYSAKMKESYTVYNLCRIFCFVRPVAAALKATARLLFSVLLNALVKSF